MVRVKICGFTEKKDVKDAIELGIDIIGLNFYPESPRYISLKKAERVLEDTDSDITTIGVFVNPDEKMLVSTVKALNLSGIQLHGDEKAGFIKRIREWLPLKIIIKGIRVKNKDFLRGCLNKYCDVDFYLLDAYSMSIPGGTGKRIDPLLLEDVEIPWHRTFLSGGITPENVKGVLEKFQPYGIDVASGVESSPGVKDKNKIEKLLRNIRAIQNETS